MDEIDQMNRHITVLDNQNIELENELDRFLASDQEIRSKLLDRNRSPLRLTDLHLDHDLERKGIVARPIFDRASQKDFSRVEVVPNIPRAPEYRGAQTSPLRDKRNLYRE